MRIEWTEKALADLAAIAARAPQQALHIYEEIGRFEKSGFPNSYRRVRGRKDERAMSVPPHVVLYRARGDGVQIRRIRDSRRRRVGPW